MDAGSLAGLKALYSDARKRAGVAAGIGAYLYTALAAVVLPIGPGARQVQASAARARATCSSLSPETEQWLRHGYRTRMNTDAVAPRPRRDARPRRARDRHGPGRARRDRHRHPEPRGGRHGRRARRPAAAAQDGTASSSASTSAAWAPTARATRPQHERRAHPAGRPRGGRRVPGPDRSPPSPSPTLPRYRPGAQLDDAEVDHIASAVIVLARAGIAAEDVAALAAHYRDRDGSTDRVWRRVLRLAAHRERHRDVYGPSPCEGAHARTRRAATPDHPG